MICALSERGNGGQTGVSLRRANGGASQNSSHKSEPIVSGMTVNHLVAVIRANARPAADVIDKDDMHCGDLGGRIGPLGLRPSGAMITRHEPPGAKRAGLEDASPTAVLIDVPPLRPVNFGE